MFPDFESFFEACHGTPAYRWQRDLAEQVYRDRRWPPAVDLPTGTGKTSAIDIALYLLARAAHEDRPGDFPRRIFLVVDRRVLVDQAWARGKHLLRRITEDARLHPVCEALASLGPDAPVSIRLRGACPSDRRWATSPDQVLLVAATVDQVGSRLLLRGYGVSPSMRPVEAGLVGQDALILLDEAHLAGPFLGTLSRVDELEPVRGLPHRRQVVPISATLATGITGAFRLPNDLLRPEEPDAPEDRPLHRRLFAKKRLSWSESPPETLLRDLNDRPTVLVVANTVATARRFYRKLVRTSGLAGRRSRGIERVPFLVTGRMRPVDRQRITDEIEGRLAERLPTLVVSTQCIEAGVDWDFDALITECASWDALVQRLGRLNRTGREEQCPAHVVPAQRTFRYPRYAEGKPADNLCPIYLEREKATAEWLAELGECDVAPGALPDPPPDAIRPPGRAPLLLPEYLDLWSQNRADGPGYDVATFVHGQTEDRQVQVVWRDLDLEADGELLQPLLKALPPSSLEAAPLPIGEFRNWAAGREVVALLGEPELRRAEDIGPGATVVVPLDYGGIADHRTFDPTSSHRVEDVSATALREHRQLEYEMHEAPRIDDESSVEEQVRAWLGESPERARLAGWDWIDLGHRWLFVSRLPTDTEEDDGSSFRRRAVALERHLNGVEQRTRATARRLGLPEDLSEDLALAARLHDLGKLDDRFQRLCERSTGGEPLGKSALSWWARQRRAAVSDYPRGERHEALSVELMHRHGLHRHAHDPELVEHLVASHHGWARPFTRVAQGRATIRDSLFGLDLRGSVAHEEAARAPARFARMQRRYGWLGLAWLESIVRLADHRQSEAEERGEISAFGGPPLRVGEASSHEWSDRSEGVHELSLPALSGLVVGDYLASLGVLRALDIANMSATLRWHGTAPILGSSCQDLERVMDVLEDIRASFSGRWPGELNQLGAEERAALIRDVEEPFRSVVLSLICEPGRSEMDFVSGGRGGFVSTFVWTTTASDRPFRRDALRKTLTGPRELVRAKSFRWSALAAQGPRRPAVASADGRAEPWIEWLSLLGVSGLLCVPESRANGTLAACSTAFLGRRAHEKVLRYPLWQTPLPWAIVRFALASSPRTLPDALWCRAERRSFGRGTNTVYGFGPGQPFAAASWTTEGGTLVRRVL